MKIAIASGKGGTGKTTLATNLAAFMALNRDVVLVDLDVEEPNSGLFIHGKIIQTVEQHKMIPDWDLSKCSICGHCQSVCKFNAIIQLASEIVIFPELCHSCYACSELCPEHALPMIPQKIGVLNHYTDQNISLIESRLDIGQEQSVPLIAKTHEYINQEFDADSFIIYDSPPGTSCPVIEATKSVDYVILVTEPTPFGLHDLKLAVETMKTLKKPMGVVINRYGIGNNDVIEYCETEKISILAKIQNSREVAELYSGGQLIFSKVKDLEEQLQKICNALFSLNEGGKL